MKIKTENHKNIVNDYILGKTMKMIAEDFGVTISCINNILNINNISKRTNKNYRKYKLNLEYFEKIDTQEKASILGFICADGSNNIKKGQVCISIHRKDIDYLNKINERIQPDKLNSIIVENNKKYSAEDDRGKMMRLSIYSQKICQDLLKLGLTPNKSLTLKFPDLTKELLPHFIRGYFDGDGSIGFSNRRKKRDYTITFAVSDNFGQSLKEIIVSELLINCHLRKVGKISEIIISGNNQVEKFLDWIYFDSKIRLDRKYNLYLEMKEYFKNYKI